MIMTIHPKNGKVTYPQYYQHWGGHLPFPPQDCPCKEHIFTRDGIHWLDIAFCSINKCGKAPCPRRKEYGPDEYNSERKRLSEIQNSQRGKRR